ncbi:MAG: DUF3883 domain-containing protein [Candidatus Cloacimonetes bacterium]|nr:DUF3883 domain-containing protein [Candidatus Cloacimonadota bacterium]
MYELILFFYLVSFLYITIVTSSWRSGCIESSFWFVANGLFMLLLVLEAVPTTINYILIFAAVNTARATMLLLIGRGAKVEIESEDDVVIEEEPAHKKMSVWESLEQSGAAREYDKKAIKTAIRHLSKLGYSVEDFSDKQIGYDLRISKRKTVFYVLVKIKIEADGLILVSSKEYEKAKEYKNIYFLYIVLGGVDPWEEEIHIVYNPYLKLNFSYDTHRQEYAIDCDDIRAVSQTTFDVKRS